MHVIESLGRRLTKDTHAETGWFKRFDRLGSGLGTTRREIVEGCTASRRGLVQMLENTSLVCEPLPASGTKRSLLNARKELLPLWHEGNSERVLPVAVQI